MTDQSNNSRNTDSKIIKGWPLHLAQGMFALSVLLYVIGLFTTITNPIQKFEYYGIDAIGLPLIILAYCFAGYLIVARKPNNYLGWILLFQGVLYGYRMLLNGLFIDQASLNVASQMLGVMIMMTGTATWLTNQLIPYSLMPLFFPTGNLISKRWRWIVWLFVIGNIVYLFASGAATELDAGGGVMTSNPYGFISDQTVINAMINFGTVTFLIAMFASIATVIIRYRRVSLEERSQMKWFLYLFGFILIINVVGGLLAQWLQGILPADSLLLGLLALIYGPPYLSFWLTSLVIPVVISIAILRYKYWNIDVVINRTAVYGALTLLLVLLFVGSLLVVTNVASGFENGPLVAGIATAAIFVVGFQPLRRGLQRFVDQRFYNIQIDYQKTPTPLQFFSQKDPANRFGDYRNLELIGRGGMAEVYRAYQEGSNDPIAIKILPQDLSQDAEYRERFAREVQVMQALQHPNIVNVHTHGEFNGQPYIVMEFIKGRDLADHLRHVGRVSIPQAQEILSGTAGALDFAHGKGLIHRDIKPSNLMLDQETAAIRPVLMDFGIAKILGRSLMTSSGFLGTLDYISPEQIQGEEAITPKADIYSLAVMAYEILAGETPYKKNNPGAILLAHLSQSPPDIRKLQPGLPKATAEAVITALSKSPEERYDSASAFVQALELPA